MREPKGTADAGVPLLVLEPQRGWRALEFSVLWRYRHLLAALWWRDVKASQKQTVLGMVWLFLAPLLSMAVFTVVFGKLAKLPSDGIPYPLFVFAGQILWMAFAPTIQSTTTSVVSHGHFINKVYFPRLLIPLAAALSSVLNLGFMLISLFTIMWWYGVSARWTAALAIPIVLLVIVTALGIGMLLAPFNVKYRDVGMLTQYVLQLGLYLTPVVYPISLVSDAFRPLLLLNPLAGYISTLRWALYGGQLPMDLLGSSLIATAVLLVGGAFVFVRKQGRFADII